jgi:hypothetical protein
METKKLLLWVDIGLIAAIAISAVLLGVTVSQGPPQPKVPVGVPYSIVYLSPTEVKVEFGNFSENIMFTDMVIDVTSPNGDKSRADIKNATVDYVQTTSLKSLANIRISSTGVMEKGTSFTLMNYKNLQVGAWAFKLTHRTTGHQVSGGTVIVPATDITPQATFNKVQTISPSEININLEGVSPSTEINYCYIETFGPDLTKGVMRLNDTSSLSFVMSDGTILTYRDSNRDGLLNQGDYLNLKREAAPLSRGEWSIVLKFNFTEEKIAVSTFDIT